MKTVKQVNTAIKRHNEAVNKSYTPDHVPRGNRQQNSDVRIICPKTGEVLDVIENAPFAKQNFNYKFSFDKKGRDLETEFIDKQLEEKELVERYLK